MKLLSLFLASSFAQDAASDKWVGYDYGSYGSYGSYDTGLGAKFVNEAEDYGIGGRLGNGLTCFTCHGRMQAGTAESVGNNAWFDCVDNGMDMECQGDQRSCMTEERRRYDITVEVKAGCKNPEACMYQWRRNERYMPMFHLFGDQSQSANPMFFDDECASSANPKHGGTQRSQWESVCRSCCAADDSGTGCNGPTVGASPIGNQCGGAGCAAAASSATMFSMYSIIHIPAFMDAAMQHGRAHPGEGRNSAPEDKFAGRVNLGAGLIRQTDRISQEDQDFHNDRHGLAGTNGAFGSR
jgi:hypothetical protein